MRGLKFAKLTRYVTKSSRTSHGVRGLKFRGVKNRRYKNGRTSHGVRGLKYVWKDIDGNHI